MGRQPRLLGEGLVYLAINRGNNRERVCAGPSKRATGRPPPIQDVVTCEGWQYTPGQGQLGTQE